MKITPINNNIVVKKIEDDNKSIIKIVGEREENNVKGRILGISKAIIDKGFAVGDVVMYGKMGETLVDSEENNISIINLDDIIVKVEV